MGEAAELEKDGVERHLQEALADAPQFCGEGFRLVRREWPTDIGPVDLMCRDEGDGWIAVEIKRIATIDAVEQLTRYLERIRARSGDGATAAACSSRSRSSRRRARSPRRAGSRASRSTSRSSAASASRTSCCSASAGSPATNDLIFAGSRSGGPCPKQRDRGLELGEPALARLVQRNVVGEDRGRLAQAVGRREDVHVEEDVAADQRAVGLAPERDVAGAVAGRVEHDEAVAELVALAQLARRARPRGSRRRGRACWISALRARRDRRGAVAQVRRVRDADPDRHAERLMHVLRAARVVVVDVRQRVRARPRVP